MVQPDLNWTCYTYSIYPRRQAAQWTCWLANWYITCWLHPRWVVRNQYIKLLGYTLYLEWSGPENILLSTKREDKCVLWCLYEISWALRLQFLQKYGTNIRLTYINISQCLRYSEIRLWSSWAKKTHLEPIVTKPLKRVTSNPWSSISQVCFTL